MTAEIQVIVIAHTFPPNAEVGAKRVARFCRYLPDFGIRPIVLTPEERFYNSVDHSFRVPAGTRVERTAVLRTPLDWYKKWKLRISGRALERTAGETSSDQLQEAMDKESSRGFLRRHLLALLQTPDMYWGWYLPAIRAAERLIECEHIDAILSTAPPWTGHLIARHLKRKYRIPWIADFRDQWSSDPWRALIVPPWQRPIGRHLEKSCVDSADLVICVTEFITRSFVHHYPLLNPERFVTLTNGYDDLEGGLPPAVSSEQASRSVSETEMLDRILTGQVPSTRLLAHLGDLYAGRRIDTFCEATASLIQSGRLDPGSIQVLFLGNADPAIVAAARERTPDLFLKNRIIFHPRVGWQHAQQILGKAKLLVIFQGDHPGVTAKFYEYLRTGKPVLAVVREGALSDIIDATGAGLWADPEDPANIAEKLLKALLLPVRSPEEVQRLAAQYHYRSLTGRLADWLRRLTVDRHGQDQVNVG